MPSATDMSAFWQRVHQAPTNSVDPREWDSSPREPNGCARGPRMLRAAAGGAQTISDTTLLSALALPPRTSRSRCTARRAFQIQSVSATSYKDYPHQAVLQY